MRLVSPPLLVLKFCSESTVDCSQSLSEARVVVLKKHYQRDEKFIFSIELKKLIEKTWIKVQSPTVLVAFRQGFWPCY